MKNSVKVFHNFLIPRVEFLPVVKSGLYITILFTSDAKTDAIVICTDVKFQDIKRIGLVIIISTDRWDG